MAAVLASAPVVASAASAASAPSPDRTATDAYLTAVNAYTQAALANVPATRAALTGLTARVGAECPGVLRGAPPGPSPSAPFARGVGESKREDEQLSELEGEANSALRLTLEQANRQAYLEFIAATHALSWSNPTLTRAVSEQDAGFEAELALPIPNICADAQAWVASGYRTLPATTKELAAKQRATVKRASSAEPVERLLAAYEGPAERAVLAKTRTLDRQWVKALLGLSGVEHEFAANLGIARETEASVSHPPAGAIVIAKGKTATGAGYEVLLRPHGLTTGREAGCPASHLNIEIVTTLHARVEGCYPRSGSTAPPRVGCNQGLLTVEAQTGAAVRRIGLLLSNGRRIVSHVAFVPARLGGPTGFYYQVVRGPSPVPVSLTELNAHGKVLRVVRLHRLEGCVEHTLKFLHDGIRKLVRSRVPQGPAFSIVGEAYRFFGRIHFAMKVEIVGAGGGGESPHGRKPNLFSWAVWRECKPHPYAILYGLLKQPNDMVLARTSGTLRPLRKAAIPAHLHAGGVLVYGASATVPSELQVRNGAGKTVLTEKLGRLGKESIETCEGEAEGSSQAG